VLDPFVFQVSQLAHHIGRQVFAGTVEPPAMAASSGFAKPAAETGIEASPLRAIKRTRERQDPSGVFGAIVAGQRAQGGAAQPASLSRFWSTEASSGSFTFTSDRARAARPAAAGGIGQGFCGARPRVFGCRR